MTAYGARPDLRDVLVIGVSQSGGSPDLVQSMQVARDRGAFTLAVTNAPEAPLARAAETHLDVLAGTERAVAATKSYTAQLLTLYLLVDAMAGGDGAAARELPRWGKELLERDAALASAALRYRFAERARGHGSRVLARDRPGGGAQAHGDVVHVGPGLLGGRPAARPHGHGGRARARHRRDGRGGRWRRDAPRAAAARELRADVFCVRAAAAVTECDAGIELPPGVPEAVSPVLEILPLQLLALHLAVARGGDPDAPRGLRKVTETL